MEVLVLFSGWDRERRIVIIIMYREKYRAMLAPDLQELALELIPISLVLYLRNPSQGP
jgi:hypothetical protein